jgi:hypothetical protein
VLFLLQKYSMSVLPIANIHKTNEILNVSS